MEPFKCDTKDDYYSLKFPACQQYEFFILQVRDIVAERSFCSLLIDKTIRPIATIFRAYRSKINIILNIYITERKNTKNLRPELLRSKIITEFKNNRKTDKIQGVRFGKNGYEFNGSKIDRAYSFSKISYLLYVNEKLYQNEGKHHSESNRANLFNLQDNTKDITTRLEKAASLAGMDSSAVYPLIEN